jgi:hypothetical protein
MGSADVCTHGTDWDMADRAAELLTKIKKILPCPKRIWTNNEGRALRLNKNNELSERNNFRESLSRPTRKL